MMGYQDPPQDNLFHYHIYLETRVRQNHPLRRIKELIDFGFIYDEVKETYGTNGNVSVPPPVILKLMLLLILYNVRSERELMDTIPERLDWLWFLGLTIESPIPDHSILSKARTRWGHDAFKHFFERIVLQCVEAGLVDGTRIFMDSSLIDADASNNSVVDTHAVKRYLNERYRELEKRLDAKVGETGESQEADSRKTRTVVNSRYVSTTDSDASIVRHAGGRAKLRYKTHRAVDGLYEVITTVKVTPGAVDDGREMGCLIEEHEKNTDVAITTVVADSKYGTKENLLLCHDRGIQAHVPTIKALTSTTSSREGIFPEERFVYRKETDTYTCPAGKVLKKRSVHEDKQNIEYAASKKDCDVCSLRSGCTRSKGFRTVQRHVRQEELEHMLALTKTYAAKNDLKTRQQLMERSYAGSTRFGFDRARWRGLWKVCIQEYFVSAIQNIETLIRYGKKPTKGVRTAPLKTLARTVWAYTNRHLPLQRRGTRTGGLTALGFLAAVRGL
jgi:transposase